MVSLKESEDYKFLLEVIKRAEENSKWFSQRLFDVEKTIRKRTKRAKILGYISFPVSLCSIILVYITVLLNSMLYIPFIIIYAVSFTFVLYWIFYRERDISSIKIGKKLCDKVIKQYLELKTNVDTGQITTSEELFRDISIIIGFYDVIRIIC